MLALISGSSAFSKSSLNIWKFTVHVLLKPGLENFEHHFASVWDECSCAVVWTFFGIAFLWDWNENWPFPVLWSLLSFPNLLAYWVQHFHSIIFEIAKGRSVYHKRLLSISKLSTPPRSPVYIKTSGFKFFFFLLCFSVLFIYFLYNIVLVLLHIDMNPPWNFSF